MSYVYHTTCILLLLLFSLVLKGGTPPPQDTAGVLKELSKGVDSIKKGNYPFALKTAWRNIPWLVKADQKNILAKCYRMAGSAHERLAAHDSAIIYYRKALDLFASINNKKQVAQCHHNIAAVMYARGDYEKSLGEYVEAIKIREDIKDTIGLAWSQNNIGNIYWYQKAYDDALDHYIKAREMFTLKNYNEGVGLTTGNMALIYETKGDTLKALESYKAAVKANQEAENEIAVAGVLCNLGSFYFRNKQYKEATACYNRALEINERLQNYYGLSLTYSGMASLCEIKNDLDCSEKWLLKALANNNKSGDRQSNIGTYRNLSSVYFKKGKNRDAYLALSRSYELNDSVNTGDKLAEIEARYGKEKQEKEIKLLQQANDINELELKRKQTTIYAAVVVGILILIISGFFVKNYYQKKKANRLLEDKNHEILSQKNIIETKQKEVLDSIHYAKKIQHALIDNQEIIKAGFKDSFTLYQPKDIVSGDFYWTTSVALPTAGRELFYLAVCDSTGHGVPGAFMSLLNISFLNEAINEKRIYQPNEIFNYVRQKLIASISKDGSQDGMDAVLFCFERDNNGLLKNITYSAANNNPLIIKTDTIVQLPADKMPVGKGVKEEPFKLYTAELSKDDLLYLYTDGFADQFGGPKGKKFKYKQLNDLLLGLSPLSLNEQNQKLKHSFETWRGPLEQLDDVCIIGIKI